MQGYGSIYHELGGSNSLAAGQVWPSARAENIEKDLYVCWVLDFLFNRRATDPIRLYFKGGTSLSKDLIG